MKIVVIVVVLIIGIYAVYKAYSVSSIDKSLDKKLREHPIILDVRTPVEYESGHIAGSVNIPLSQLRTAPLSSLDHKRPVITCCSHGLRSIKAVEILSKRGFSNAINGGAWTDLEEKINKH